MRKAFVTFMLAALAFCSQAQSDTRPVVGVAAFSCDEDATYAGLVTEKVVEMLTNSHRFQVVDRTSNDKVRAELELQKSEAFLDSKNLVDQNSAVAAEKMITGHIAKLPVYAIKTNGRLQGYKASVAFQMKVVDVATGLSTEATSFQGKTSDVMLSPQSAISAAMESLAPQIQKYFTDNFPITGKILKITETKGTKAKSVLLNIGREEGLKGGENMLVQYVETLEGKPFPNDVAMIKVVKLTGDNFAEASVSKGGDAIMSHFEAGHPLKVEVTK